MHSSAPQVAPKALVLPSDAEIRARAIGLLATILERDPETLETAHALRADLGMDSLSALEFLSALSHEFDINLEVEETYGLTTLDEVVSVVGQRLRSPA
jgi:acyl carrier protein